MQKTKPVPKLTQLQKKRFISKIEFSSGCWNWNGNMSMYGYGQICLGTKKPNRYRAHRVSYVFFNKKEIPTGMIIDHLCDNRRCVNPSHLKVCTDKENVSRAKTGVSYINSHKTHCIHGHRFSKENTLVWRGYRICRECRRRVIRNRINKRLTSDVIKPTVLNYKVSLNQEWRKS